MHKLRRALTWTRRLALAVCAILFTLSCFTVLTAGKGPFAGPEFSYASSVSGVIVFVDLHPSAGPRAKLAPYASFIMLSDARAQGRIYTDAFHWQTLGFQFIFRKLPASAYGRPSSVFALVIPYWPLPAILFYPEFRLLMFRLRARTISKMSPTEPPAESSVVQKDLTCVHCGYNLRTLGSTRRCPECGSLVADTLTLNSDLARSRPNWLRSLALGNRLLLLSRILLAAIYIEACSYNNSLAGGFAIAMCILHVAGTFFLTAKEHPHLYAADGRRALLQRFLALASALSIGAGIYQQATVTPITAWSIKLWPPLLAWSGAGFWRLPAIALLLTGWLLYCTCVFFECRYLAKLAARLLDPFMTRHCKIAALGASAGGLLALCVMPDILDWQSMSQYLPAFLVLVIWSLFLLWISFLNAYCAARFTQQYWLAAERWRRKETNPALA